MKETVTGSRRRARAHAHAPVHISRVREGNISLTARRASPLHASARRDAVHRSLEVSLLFSSWFLYLSDDRRFRKLMSVALNRSILISYNCFETRTCTPRISIECLLTLCKANDESERKCFTSEIGRDQHPTKINFSQVALPRVPSFPTKLSGERTARQRETGKKRHARRSAHRISHTSFADPIAALDEPKSDCSA